MPDPGVADSQLAEFIEFARQLARVAGDIILPHFRAALDVTNKQAESGLFDPVTIADRDAEQAIRNEISHKYPGHGIHGEEHGQHKNL